MGRSQQNENEESLKKTLKSFEAGGKSKRRADMSPKEAPSRKRSAFGDITNVITLRSKFCLNLWLVFLFC